MIVPQEHRRWVRLVLLIAMALLMIAFTLASTTHVASAQETETATEEEATFSPDVVTATTTVNLRLREGPGLQYPILHVLPLGTVVGFTGFTDATRTWVQVDTLEHPVGWVAAAFLTFVPAELEVQPADIAEEEEPAAPEVDVAFSPDVVTATTTVNLRLREGPGLQHQILDILPVGTVVGFTGFTDATRAWVQVDTADTPVGWVAARFLSFVPAELQVRPEDVVEVEPAPPAAPPPFPADVVTATTVVNLNIREGPGLQHPIIDVLPMGTVVGFTGFTDASRAWVQVDTADTPVGWVAARFLSFVPAELQVWDPSES